jgi:hypothetical protein
MESLLDLITSQLGQDSYQKIGQQLGVDATQSRSAVESALPILISALARNAQQPQGASSLANALDRDHDGSILQNLDGFLKSPDQGAGGAILGHVLGGQRGKVEEYVSRSSGLSLGNTGPLLEMLAPIVLGSLGQQKKTQGLDAGGLAGMLGGLLSGGLAGNSTKTTSGKAKSPQQQLLASLLDSDKDGDISDDLLNMGGKLLGGLFKKK